MRTHIGITIIFVFVFVFFFEGCTSAAQKKYPRELVHTYAELLLLHEKEKINGTTPDSIYQMKVVDFFSAKKLSKEDFRKQVEDVLEDDEAWRMFLAEATTVMDSLKAAKPM